MWAWASAPELLPRDKNAAAVKSEGLKKKLKQLKDEKLSVSHELATARGGMEVLRQELKAARDIAAKLQDERQSNLIELKLSEVLLEVSIITSSIHPV